MWIQDKIEGSFTIAG